MFVELHAQTDIGRIRQANEDNFLVLDLASTESWSGSDGKPEPPEKLRRFEVEREGLVLVVSDGMGGALAGDVASRMAVESVREMLTEEDTHKTDGDGAGARVPLVECLRNATGYANYAIHRKSLEDPRCSGMGATLTAAAVSDDVIDFVQVGDSRAYLIRGDEIKLATKDQSLVQQLVDVGQITEEDAETHMFRNVILQALGAQSDLTPVLSRVRLQQGDIVLLCSDGLSGKLRAEEMRDILAASKGDLAAACDALVKEANKRGGEDNITVVLARFDGNGLAAHDAQAISVELPPLDDAPTLSGMDDDTSPLP
ncbi:MAG TPA: PP2C family serine/threonine-protein phosphatase [Pyrinomonadaceae bacterium]|nr:PP2C family serine/threonine-protein phosphatase [Pyrinomonadaceae bacterium]